MEKNMNINIDGIRPANDYFKEEQERLKLNITEEEYEKLKDELGIKRRTKHTRARAQPKHIEVEPPLKFNCDYPFLN